MAFRLGRTKKGADAKVKLPGENVVVSRGKIATGNEMLAAISRYALQSILARLPQSKREHYDGRTEITGVGTPQARITVHLTDKRCGIRIGSEVVVPPDGGDRISYFGKQLADGLVHEMLNHERVCKGTPERGEDVYEYEQRMIESKSKMTPLRPPKPPKPKKPVCPICGPEDELYPDWEGTCNHD